MQLFELVWEIADKKHGYQIYGSPNPSGEPTWGPWGYENRPIGGTSTPSNHSRGKAFDANAPRNPQSYSFQSDMPPAMVADFEACGFYWGGRYEGGTKFDTMHFEYGYSPDDVARHTALAQQLLGADPGHDPTGEDDMPYSEQQVKQLVHDGVEWALEDTASVDPLIIKAAIREQLAPVVAKLDALLAKVAPSVDDIWAKGIASEVMPGLVEPAWRTVQAINTKVYGGTSAPPPADQTYTVAPGDTLGAIAKKFGVAVADLVAWNGLANPDAIEVGQVLKVGKA